MSIPFSAPAILIVDDPRQEFSGTLGEQVLRFLSFDRSKRGRVTIAVTSEVLLRGWATSRTRLDSEAIRELADEMTARGLI